MNVTKKEIQQIIKEEYEIVRLEQLMFKEQARIDKLHQEMQLEVLSEGWKEELPHIGLDVLGLIPGLGEAADLTNAGLYAKKGEYLMAALSVISMIPAVGDALGKGGKIGAYLSKFGAKGGTKAGAALGKLFGKHMPKITKALSSLKSNKLIGPYIDDMAKAVTKYADDLGTKAADEILPQLQKAVGVAVAPKVSKNKYMAIAQKANTKRVTRQNRQAIAQNLSGGEGEEQAPAAAPAAADKIKSDADDILKQVARRQKVAENKKMDVINKMLSAIEQFGNDPEVIDTLGTDGLSGALEAIKDKILSNQDAEEDGTSLASIMEKELTKPEKKEKEKIVKGMKKDKKGFKQRYGDDAESVMYATATKLAKEKK